MVAPKDHSKPDYKSSELDSSFVDDIELPAGRLWIEQQALDDADDETVLSVEDGKTLRALPSLVRRTACTQNADGKRAATARIRCS